MLQSQGQSRVAELESPIWLALGDIRVAQCRVELEVLYKYQLSPRAAPDDSCHATFPGTDTLGIAEINRIRRKGRAILQQCCPDC